MEYQESLLVSIEKKCTNSIGSYTCSCSRGYEKAPVYNPTDQLICIDIDECSLNTTTFCGLYSICHNADGSYDCTCVDGFQMNMTSSLCEDVDECSDGDRCGEYGTCGNTIGDFECICNEGFENSKGKSITNYFSFLQIFCMKKEALTVSTFLSVDISFC